ncbi:hypothetical protein GSI_00697 [Ganoderma sinense ZZ0214-1]|uniref:Uncharacterized protein n=1 Tax=Ganoderma sinense ZZ0214-1 TaxID=1077348 RepID=A0A2G8STA9_9APHY|nr:hypothetical protein GSI_00697 [Ganoderma sinense ZZ0214-1]
MLSPRNDSATATPRRPLPPAKARRSTSLTFAALHRDSAPPPPYAPPLEEMLLDLPVTVTTHLVNASGSTDGIGLPTTPGIEDWMNEKSREELSGLLLKADGIIKSRESELTVTTALCKTLYDDNVTLKSKHEALLARLPGSGTGTTPTTSPPVPQLHLDVPSESASYGGSVAFPTSSDQSTQPLGLAARYRRARRVSVTPAELASLSDQNAELIEKLEKLETESQKADHAGKRKLRKLEQEIQTLRDELEKTQARGVELEQQAKAATNAVAAQKRKEEREARLQALKEKSVSVSDYSADDIRDFAPPSYLSRSSPIKRSESRSSTFADSSLTSSDLSGSHPSNDSSFDENDPPFPDDPESYFPTPPGSSVELPAAEYAIVSQLLLKIRELEETNTQIKEQQRLTEEQVRATQSDVESIRRVYEYLDDEDIDLELEEDEGLACSDVQSPPDHTIRFSSLRRSIAGPTSKYLVPSESDVFAGGISQGMQSTVRNAMMNRIAHNKARKTVVGLFDSDADTSTESASWSEYPQTLKVSPAFRHPETAWPSDSGPTPPSPTLGTLPASVDGPATGRSLGSELGSEYGDDWAHGGINHHLRATSLCDLAGLNSSPVSPSESTIALPPISLCSVEGPSGEWDGLNPSTPPREPPQLKVQPPTPTPDKVRTSAMQRKHQLSQTVRARTNRWVEGRFLHANSWKEEPAGSSSTQSLDRRSSAFFRNVNAEVLEETFDDVAGQIRRVASRGTVSPSAFGLQAAVADADETAKDQERYEEADRSVAVRQERSMADPFGGKHAGIVGFVIEAWLWLQFIVVVALFLWAMAKRGPKVVLESERRNAQRSAR